MTKHPTMPATLHTLDSLRLATHDLAPPFSIQLDEGAPWHCSAVLRMLPGRRVVLRLKRASEPPVVAKLFYRRKDYQREYDGHQQLQQQAIDTPAMVHHYQNPEAEQALVLYSFCAGQSLLQCWQQADQADQRLAILGRAVEACAHLHRAGLVQADIHLDNFLATDDHLQVIDCAGISAHPTPLDADRARDNLALLLAQLPATVEDWIAPLWQGYRRVVADPGFDSSALAEAVQRMRTRRWQHYRKKLYRDCSEFHCQARFNRWQVARRDALGPALEQLLVNPDPLIECGQLLKQGNTATVSRVEIEGHRWVVKRYNLKGAGHALSRGLRPSRAWHYWSNAYRLRFEGIATPTPLALVEERFGPLRRRAFLVMESVEGTDLHTALSQPARSPCPPERLKQQVVDLFDTLYRTRLSHGDLKASNLLVTAEGIQLIDLDSLRMHRRPGPLKSALRKDLDRFLRNWEGALREEFETLLAPVAKRLSA
ncbi:lipopolysaccharide kinase InaA family protein [Aestuariirhabdus litorea]|uniref:lipopolysaccharide kinase InaA family protein n=1 Tax=Aestuariirhabdus litorea TaxID=2528527 RepID=UPI001A9F8B0C|nr:lipopolysaccharide kinase InaA family protein [Aestuariirhabdus litorea]